MIHKKAVVAGSTGLIGSRLVDLLVAAPEYSVVIALARKPKSTRGKLQWRKADFDGLDKVLGDVRGSEAVPLDVFCCLGTTIKVAGSQDAFRHVDFEFVVNLGRWARGASARRFVLVSALGADPASRVFYNRVKGDAEQTLGTLGIPSLVVLRPSLLDGDRKEHRSGEQFALAVTRPIRRWLPKSVRPVLDIDVAASMLLAARADRAPLLIESAQMHEAATRLKA